MTELNSTAASLLGFLHDGPQTGWELVSAVETRIGPFWSLTRSQVYRELSSLDAAGLVTPGPIGRRDSRPYTITAAGREAFADWAARGPGDATIRLPLLLFVALGRHMPAGGLEKALSQSRQHQADRLRAYLSLRSDLAESGADVFQLATLDYGIANARATVRWLDSLMAALTED